MKITDFLYEKSFGAVLYSTDKTKLDLTYIHDFLKASYWAKDIPVEILSTSIENSIAIGIYSDQKQIGFARVITDGATFAWLADVFVDEASRGNGVSKFLMEYIMSFPFVPGLRRFMLATLDAHGLYRQYGFEGPTRPDRLMEILHPNIYQRALTK